MTSTDSIPGVLSRRPQRADARRNYENLIAAARETFATDGVSASLEEIARTAPAWGSAPCTATSQPAKTSSRASTPTTSKRCAPWREEVASLPPWDALSAWLLRFVDYLATKRALAEAVNFQSEFFQSGRAAVMAVGEKLLTAAQDAGLARPRGELRRCPAPDLRTHDGRVHRSRTA